MLPTIAYRMRTKFERTSLSAYAMNRFTRLDLKTRILGSINYSILLFAAIIVAFLIGIARLSGSNAANSRQILEEAINRDIIHCYSIEGMYPPSLEYIEEHYGLNYDHKRFIIDYESIGSNLMPNVTIIEREYEE